VKEEEENWESVPEKKYENPERILQNQQHYSSLSHQ